jgi:very-short-patch-repair endonuclease
LLDCAPRLTDARLTRTVNDARVARLCRPTILAELLARYPHHPGARRLRPFADPASPLTRSPFEDRFRSLCSRYGLPAPRFNATVCGFEVDAVFEPEKLIVELDSWEFHQDRTAFITDRARDADTLQAGYATLRITWERPDEQEADRIARILEMRRGN